KTPEGFVHPVVRSILLHFWLAYDHPFKDGNGRCARALFYWSMLQHDYWLCQFISISQIILKAGTQYARAFLHTESDGNDATYFVLHQLRVIEQAIEKLHEYLDRKVAQRRELERQLQLGAVLNERQLDLVGHALRHPDAEYEIAQHQTTFGIVYETARTDLLDLAKKGLFIQRKRGRTFYFHPVPDLDQVLKALQSAGSAG
ncbi:MAG: Fic family protein, partial [Phycisphaerae bacterium]